MCLHDPFSPLTNLSAWSLPSSPLPPWPFEPQVTNVIRGTLNPSWNFSALFPLDLPTNRQGSPSPAFASAYDVQATAAGYGAGTGAASKAASNAGSSGYGAPQQPSPVPSRGAGSQGPAPPPSPNASSSLDQTPVLGQGQQVGSHPLSLSSADLEEYDVSVDATSSVVINPPVASQRSGGSFRSGSSPVAARAGSPSASRSGLRPYPTVPTVGGPVGSSPAPSSPSTSSPSSSPAQGAGSPPPQGGAAAAGGAPAPVTAVPQPAPSQPLVLPQRLLRLEMKDVDPVPPDDDLGWAELDVSQCVPMPGQVWEQWLPLREGAPAEVLVRIAHLTPSAAAQGALPLPMAHATSAAGEQAWAMSGTGAGRAGPDGAGASTDGGASPRVEQMLLDSFTEQVSWGGPGGVAR